MASSSSTTRTNHLLPSSGYSTPASTLWDVFLSFRGIDTRSGFTSHLRTSLHRTGIRTFIDEPELRAGDCISSELQHAIKQSKVYIVVLSKNYASSGWCLDELVEILRLGVSKKLSKNEGRVAIEIVNKWRGILKEVADFSGYHVRDEVRDLCIKLTELAASGYELCENRHLMTEAEVVNEVVERVLLEINPATLEVARYPVGIDSRVADIETLLCSGSCTIDGVHCIGIHGMGGVGKTTVAKVFYNQKIRNYESSCFLADVKDICAGSKCHVSLQQQLIDDVLKRKNTTTINNIDGGINLIRERISSLKVLVVLDDIDHRNQVDYLVRNFVVGSVIILTTRNEDLLETLGVKARYRVNVLGSVHSWQLFKRHAFGDTDIKDEFMEMSEEILDHAGGLPLALTVLGSSLKNKSKDEWRCFIEDLLQVPIHDVEKSLRISFDALKLVNPKLQAFFLDIACFFIGQRKDDAAKILETCYKFVNQYIIMLKERCLITINKNNRLSMHNLLSGMGREIAGNSRLFLAKDIRDVLQNNKGTEAIEGMVDWSQGIPYSIDAETFNTMPNVRFLRLLFIKDVRGSFGKPFRDLRWLHWMGCRGLPSNFCADKLVILELPFIQISRLEEKALVCRNLKVLDMSYSIKLSNTPDFNGLPCLETLLLCSCTCLVEVDFSIGNLERLATLDLSSCKSLTSLPESICKLRALESLNLKHCSSLKVLPMELGNIESLTDLIAEELSISQLPDSLGRLSKLVMLDLSENRDLRIIPDTICNLRSLESLNLTCCWNLEALPMELGNIESLKELKADGLSISQLPGSLGRMIVLKADELNFKAYDCLQSIRNMRSVESLNISCCQSTQLANLQLPSTLKELKAYKCMSLPNLSNLQQLEKMNLSGCSSLTEIKGLEKLISVEEIRLDGCRSMKRLPSLSDLKKLKTLQLYGCSSLTEIRGVEGVTSITLLDLSDCISLERLPNLSNLQQLQTLQLTNCTSLTEIQGLEKISSLTILNLEGCTSMKPSADLSSLQLMEEPDISLQLMEGPDISLQLIKRLPDISRLQAVLDLNANDLDSSGYRHNISSDNEDGAKSDGDVSTELYLGGSKISGVTPSKKLKLNNGNASPSGSEKN